MAGAAAAMTGSAFMAANQQEQATTACADNTVVGMLQGISKKIAKIESVIGSIEEKRLPTKRAGIDIVLGAQWGDEGKGKLVDILSQVGKDIFSEHWIFYICKLRLGLTICVFFSRNTMFVPE